MNEDLFDHIFKIGVIHRVLLRFGLFLPSDFLVDNGLLPVLIVGTLVSFVLGPVAGVCISVVSLFHLLLVVLDGLGLEGVTLLKGTVLGYLDLRLGQA